MTDEQKKMKEEYYLNNHMFKTRLKHAFESGLLLFAKYGLVLLLVWLSLNFVNNLIAGSQNGTQALIYINQAMEKGYLPKVVNGQVPPKVENETTTNKP